MSKHLNRRQFITSTTAAAGVLAVGCHTQATRADDSKSPNERLNIAAIGATGRAGANVRGTASQNIVAIVDIDQNLLDKGCVAHPKARKYRDFRVMLEKEADHIDAVFFRNTRKMIVNAFQIALQHFDR